MVSPLASSDNAPFSVIDGNNELVIYTVSNPDLSLIIVRFIFSRLFLSEYRSFSDKQPESITHIIIMYSIFFIGISSIRN